MIIRDEDIKNGVAVNGDVAGGYADCVYWTYPYNGTRYVVMEDTQVYLDRYTSPSDGREYMFLEEDRLESIYVPNFHKDSVAVHIHEALLNAFQHRMMKSLYGYAVFYDWRDPDDGEIVEGYEKHFSLLEDACEFALKLLHDGGGFNIDIVHLYARR